jgi:hypothetical protein
MREEQRARTGARGGERGFGAGVPASNDDDVEAVEGIVDPDIIDRWSQAATAEGFRRPSKPRARLARSLR